MASGLFCTASYIGLWKSLFLLLTESKLYATSSGSGAPPPPLALNVFAPNSTFVPCLNDTLWLLAMLPNPEPLPLK